jgi:hypothetical protein
MLDWAFLGCGGGFPNRASELFMKNSYSFWTVYVILNSSESSVFPVAALADFHVFSVIYVALSCAEIASFAG